MVPQMSSSNADATACEVQETYSLVLYGRSLLPTLSMVYGPADLASPESLLEGRILGLLFQNLKQVSSGNAH